MWTSRFVAIKTTFRPPFIYGQLRRFVHGIRGFAYFGPGGGGSSIVSLATPNKFTLLPPPSPPYVRQLRLGPGFAYNRLYVVRFIVHLIARIRWIKKSWKQTIFVEEFENEYDWVCGNFADHLLNFNHVIRRENSTQKQSRFNNDSRVFVYFISRSATMNFWINDSFQFRHKNLYLHPKELLNPQSG